MVNCTGQLDGDARERVRRFVTAGGLLYTTDHAVHYLLEPAFPGYIRWNHKTSREEIFPMETAGYQGLLAKIGSAGHPSWQLAGGGYLFDVVDPQKVEVLMSSKLVAARYGAGTLGVRFRIGDGQVVHVTGHFFTQPGQRPEVAAAGRAFEQISANIVTSKREDNVRIDGLYRAVPRQEVVLRAAPSVSAQPVSPAGGGTSVSLGPSTRVRVLDKTGKFARVRDTEGNEGWVDADAF
jgi:hypothetical protein